MRADQLVRRSDGSIRRVRGVGRLHYNVDRTHSHWHLLPFERYELHAVSGQSLARDRKTGFCITSDHRTRRSVPGTLPKPEFTGHCGKSYPRALRIVEGISVGYGDVYGPIREGQYADVTNLPLGDYVLVHRVNAGRLLRESDYSNDAASVHIRLLPPLANARAPRVIAVRVCEDGAGCP
jgi:hypothetical protein